MKNELIVVSGAAQGIGAAVTRELVARGARVAALDIRADGLAALAAEAPERIHPLTLDLRDPAAIEETIGRIEAELGPIARLASVAGILRTGNLCDMSEEDWLETFAVNTHGVFFLCRAVARRMKPRRQGSIVITASNAARVPRLQIGAYAVSKAATAHLARNLGLELAAHGIRCNSVSPGSTDTAMQHQLWQSPADAARVIAGSLEGYRTGIPLQRIACPEDIAQSICFLLSDDSRHITLHDLCIDGGATLGA